MAVQVVIIGVVKLSETIILKRKIEIATGINVKIPTVGEILDLGESEFWNAINIMTVIPSDIKWQLYMSKIDYMKISDYELFITMSKGLSERQSLFLFEDLNLKDFKLFVNKNTKEVLMKRDDGLCIDEKIYTKLADTFRNIIGKEKKVEKAKNRAVKKILLDESHRKYLKNKDKPFKSMLEDMIITLVNSPEFPYNYQTIQDVTLVQLIKSIKQINKRVYALATIQGSMSGFVDSKKINRKAFDWMSGDNTSDTQNVSINGI